jgi:glycosyltransferase involved in cell wall biosynthesis
MAETLDIILPCYNPHDGWQEEVLTAFGEIKERLPETKVNLTIVNDGSASGVTQEMPALLQQSIPGIRWYSYVRNKGKGAALRMGMEHSNADFAIYTDIDFPYTTDSFLSIWNALHTGEQDVVAGVKNAAYYAQVPTGRKLISRLLRSMIRIFLRIPISDTQCGLKGMNAAGRTVFCSTTIERYLFDLEFIYLSAHTRNLRMQAIPIELKDGTRFSRMNPRVLLEESLNFVRIIFRRIAR